MNCSAQHHDYMLSNSISRRNRTWWTIFDIIQGTGFIEASPIFTSYYPAYLRSGQYPLTLFCLISTFICYFITAIYIVRGIGQFLKKSAGVDKKASIKAFQVVFSEWEWSISEECSIASQKKSFRKKIVDVVQHVQLKTMPKITFASSLILFCKRLFITIVAMLVILFFWFCVYRVTEFQMAFEYGLSHNESTPTVNIILNWMENIFRNKYSDLTDNDYKELSEGLCLFLVQMWVTLTVLTINNVAPSILKFLATFEYFSETKAMRILTGRLVVLQFSSIAVLIHAQLNDPNFNQCPVQDYCWEAKLGQQIYALMMFQPMLWMIYTIFSILIRLPIRLCCCKKTKSRFLLSKLDVPGCALDILNLQTLCWIGIVVAPILPLVTIALQMLYGILLTIHVALFCKPSANIQNTAATKYMFVLGSGLSFFCVLISLSLLIMFVPPSLGCSPFRGLTNCLNAVTYYVCHTSSETVK